MSICHASLTLHYFTNTGSTELGLKVFSVKKNWYEARKTCQAEGGDLVVVDKPEINVKGILRSVEQKKSLYTRKERNIP